MSEVDVKGHVLKTFTDVFVPYHLSTDNSGQVIVTDHFNNRVLLLNSQLQLERVLIDIESRVKLWEPSSLHHDQRSSRLYVLNSVPHGKREIISEWMLE